MGFVKSGKGKIKGVQTEPPKPTEPKPTLNPKPVKKDSTTKPKANK